METTSKEIAAILHSTEPMAVQFAQRVQERVKQPVSDTEILAVMQKIPTKQLSLEKVVAKVRELLKRKARQASRRQTTQRKGQRPADSAPPKKRKTIFERLGVILRENWDRAEAEGLHPNRTSVDNFVDTIYNQIDRRTATRRRILQAAKQLDQTDVLLTPALVVDAINKLVQD